jgi:RNA polymerase sigma factor (sigma-70 family)
VDEHGQFIELPAHENRDDAESRDDARWLREQVAKLPDRERQVIEWRYGLVDGQERTLEAIGQEFKLCRERVRQIENRAVARLKKCAGC